MNKDTNFQRRMFVNKYSNRPPFDLKKSTDFVEETEKRTQEAQNTGKIRYSNSSEKAYVNAFRYLEKMNDANRSKQVIPRIIESFQRIVPKKTTEEAVRKHEQNKVSSKSSLMVLYRNKNSHFGKNLPKHKLMKNLLNNLDVECDRKSLDTVPQKERRGKEKKPLSNDVERTLKEIRKENKSTSTSELVWPQYTPRASTDHEIPKIEETLPKRSIKCVRKARTLNKKPPNRVNMTVLRQNPCCASCIKDNPTKDVTSGYGKYYETENAISNATSIDERLSRKTRGSNERKTREKSFVQIQVEKLNRITKSGNVCSNSVTKTTPWKEKRNKDSMYINMMHKMRKSVPKIEKRSCYQSATTDNPDWSDNTAYEHDNVAFPKETKNAMEMLRESPGGKSGPLSLSKFSINSFQPAIRGQSENRKHVRDARKKCVGYLENKQPCFKNLLCERGDHEGPCYNKGY